MKTMKATVFHGANDIRVEAVNRPHAGIGEAVIRVTLTTICGSDLHIVRGEYPVKLGLVIGHEPVGVVEELGPGVIGYEIGDRVCWSVPSPRAANAARAFPDTSRNAGTATATKPWARSRLLKAPAQPATRRHAFEPRRLLRQTANAL